MSAKTPLLVISGPTATGKTSLAISIAQKLNGRLISADSRQIYRGLDIGTGKDHPKNFPIDLIDIKNPDQTFSSAQFYRLAKDKIKNIHQQSKLPIVVGGTGYYIKSLLSPQFIAVPPHPFFRKTADRLPVSFIKALNLIFNYRQYKDLNNSEKNNRHRLIRKLEVKIFPPTNSNKTFSTDYNILHVSLLSSLDNLRQRIDQRIKQRLQAGLLDEIKNILKNYQWSDPGLNTLAYKEFSTYFSHPNQKNKKASIELWRHHEYSYAKRQLTWFKKQKSAHFFNISSLSYPRSAINFVSKWYNQL